MKAIVYHRYGSPDVLELEELPRPVPSDDEVLLRVRAAAANPMDSHLMKGKPAIARLFSGVRGPKMTRPGVDVAGIVDAVGRNVTRFKTGDEVFGVARGSFAEYVCASQSAVVSKPTNVTFEAAAAVPVAALTALLGLRDSARVRAGQRVLINGAAGGIGTFAVQIAKWQGADVTGVCSTRNLEMVRSIGADHVIDYTAKNFTRGEERYDVIFDLMANHPLSACARVLTPGGVYVGAGIAAIGSFYRIPGRFLGAALRSRLSDRKFVMLFAKRSEEALTTLRDLLAAGTIKPVIDSRYSLKEVPDAIRQLQEGHARGKIVITVDPEVQE